MTYEEYVKSLKHQPIDEAYSYGLFLAHEVNSDPYRDIPFINGSIDHINCFDGWLDGMIAQGKWDFHYLKGTNLHVV